MVSVFKANAIAMKFFKDALKYELDETSPDEAAGEEADVEILSRWADSRIRLFSISSEGGNGIRERLFAGSIRRRRRSETMREPRPRRAAPR